MLNHRFLASLIHVPTGRVIPATVRKLCPAQQVGRRQLLEHGGIRGACIQPPSLATHRHIPLRVGGKPARSPYTRPVVGATPSFLYFFFFTCSPSRINSEEDHEARSRINSMRITMHGAGSTPMSITMHGPTAGSLRGGSRSSRAGISP